MAEMLKFKHGLQANLKDNSPELAPGTIYVTRDERAIYVDLPPYMNADQQVEAAKRIRIGDMRIFDYIEDLQESLTDDMTELTKSALYYAEKKKGMVDGVHDPDKDEVINALLKWNGSRFIRLNDVSNVTVELNDLTKRIGKLETLTSEHTTNLEGLGNRLDAIDGEEGRLAGIESRLDAIDNAEEGILKELETAVAGKADQTAFNELSQSVTNHANDAQTKFDAQADKNEAVDKAIGDINGEIGGLKTRIGNNETALALLNNNENTEGSVAHTVKTAVAIETEARNQAITGLQGNITTINGTLTSLGQEDERLSGEINKKVNTAQGTANAVMVTDASGNVVVGATVAGQLTHLANVTGDIQNQFNTINGTINGINTSLDGKATKTYVDTELAKKATNDALNGVKATAEAAATKEAFNAHVEEITETTKGLRSDLNDEISRVDGIAADVEEMQKFFDVVDNPDGTLDQLSEIVDYINRHSDEAFDMAKDIEANTKAIEDLTPRVKDVEDGLSEETTAREALGEKVAALEALTTWGQF